MCRPHQPPPTAWRRLPPTLFTLFSRRGNWADCVVTHRIAADSAAGGGDRLAEAWALSQLGSALASLRDQEAFGHLERALAIRQDLGDTLGEAQTAASLGEAHLKMDESAHDALLYLDRPGEAIAEFGDAPARHQASGEVSGPAVTLRHLGEAHARTAAQARREPR